MTGPDVAADEDLDALVRRVDPDRWLSSRFIGDARARADVIALYAFDHELGRAPRVASNPLVGEMRLAWWREALDEVFAEGPVRRHPAAQALGTMVGPRAVTREALEAMIDARYRELDPDPMTEAEALDWALGTAGAAAVLAAAMLEPGADPEPARSAGAAWALAHALGTGRPLAAAARGAAAALRTRARAEVRALGARAFPAAAHAVFIPEQLAARPGSELARRARLTWAVARGRI